MSQEDQMGETSQSATKSKMWTTTMQDGHLQIVEVTPFDRTEEDGTDLTESTKFEEVIETNKGLMQLDLLNLTLLRSEDGVESYRLVTNSESADESEGSSSNTLTCVIQPTDIDHDEQEGSESFIMVDGEKGPYVYLQSSLPQANQNKVVKTQPQKPSPTAAEILEKAKALQRAKAALMQAPTRGRRGRKRVADLPPPHELLASPNFKLFLYSCKLCDFKCNAVKELTVHKATEHVADSGKWRGSSGRYTATLQCARCTFRGTTHSQLMKHVQDKHVIGTVTNPEVYLNSAEAEAADVLVCGACGFESSSKPVFRKHIENVHKA